MKRHLLTLIVTFQGISLSAQQVASETKSFSQDPVNHPNFTLVVVSALGVIVLTLVIIVMAYVAKVIRLLKTEMTQADPAQEASARNTVSKRTAFQAYKWHLYSGGAAAITIVAIVASSQMASSTDVVAAEPVTATEETSQPAQPANQDTPAESPNVATGMERGSQVFQTNCAACHRNDGGGNSVGPNLTDEFWLHGGDSKSISATIQNGIVDKGMPAWGTILTPDKVQDVASYILSLEGTNPPDAKAPQGEKFVKTDNGQ